MLSQIERHFKTISTLFLYTIVIVIKFLMLTTSIFFSRVFFFFKWQEKKSESQTLVTKWLSYKSTNLYILRTILSKVSDCVKNPRCL